MKMESPTTNLVKNYIDKNTVRLKSLNKKAVDLGSKTQKDLLRNLQSFNKVELLRVVKNYLATRATLESPELTEATRYQFNQLVDENTGPPASSELKILLADVQREVPLNSEWFSHMAEMIETVIISPIQARLDRLENGADQIVLHEDVEITRDYLEVANEQKNSINSISISLKKKEEKIEKLKVELSTCCNMIARLKMVSDLRLNLEMERERPMEEGQEQRNNLTEIIRKGSILLSLLKLQLHLIKDSEWVLAFGPRLKSAKDRFDTTALNVKQEHRLL